MNIINYTYLKLFPGQIQAFQLCSNSFPYFQKEFKDKSGINIKYNQSSRIVYSLDSHKYLVWILKPSIEKSFSQIPLMEPGKCFTIFQAKPIELDPKHYAQNPLLNPLFKFGMIAMQLPVRPEINKIKRCSENYHETEECNRYINYLKKIAIIL